MGLDADKIGSKDEEMESETKGKELDPQETTLEATHVALIFDKFLL